MRPCAAAPRRAAGSFSKTTHGGGAPTETSTFDKQFLMKSWLSCPSVALPSTGVEWVWFPPEAEILVQKICKEAAASGVATGKFSPALVSAPGELKGLLDILRLRFVSAKLDVPDEFGLLDRMWGQVASANRLLSRPTVLAKEARAQARLAGKGLVLQVFSIFNNAQQAVAAWDGDPKGGAGFVKASMSCIESLACGLKWAYAALANEAASFAGGGPQVMVADSLYDFSVYWENFGLQTSEARQSFDALVQALDKADTMKKEYKTTLVNDVVAHFNDAIVLAEALGRYPKPEAADTRDRKLEKADAWDAANFIFSGVSQRQLGGIIGPDLPTDVVFEPDSVGDSLELRAALESLFASRAAELLPRAAINFQPSPSRYSLPFQARPCAAAAVTVQEILTPQLSAPPLSEDFLPPPPPPLPFEAFQPSPLSEAFPPPPLLAFSKDNELVPPPPPPSLAFSGDNELVPPPPP
ncbi:hypothetical protein ElyMa_002515600, partial [Elysia marginata]